jgi:hypothetical protein
MILLNVETVETLVFSDTKLRNSLSGDFGVLIEQWKLTQTLPFLRSLRKRCVLDFLDRIEARHVELISDRLGGQVVVEGVDTRVVRNVDCDKVEELECSLSKFDGFPNFSLTRTATGVGVTFWR